MGKDVFEHIIELKKQGRPFAIATVVETVGSVSAKTSSKAVIDDNGGIVCGWVGGGCAESATQTEAIRCMETGDTGMLDIDLDDEMLGAGMPCGGHMKVYVEPVLPKPTLWIMGHGCVAETLCILGDLMGLTVVVNDPGAVRYKYPNATKIIDDDLDYSQLTPSSEDFVVIATQHKGDHESIKRALISDSMYIALIASRKRSALVMEYLRDEGLPEDELARVMAPSGLDLGARTPEEIALCVISELTMIRRDGSGRRMKDKLGEYVERKDP